MWTLTVCFFVVGVAVGAALAWAVSAGRRAELQSEVLRLRLERSRELRDKLLGAVDQRVRRRPGFVASWRAGDARRYTDALERADRAARVAPTFEGGDHGED